jgi:Domain of unknown function (DUF4191)
MARTKKNPNKEPGRIKQMLDVLKMTRRYDPSVTWYLALSVLVPVLIALIVGFVFSPPQDNPIGFVLVIVVGIMAGILVFLIVLGRRAEKAAYGQIAGQPGAVGAVLKGSLRGGWIGSEMPVTMSPKTKDAVYRAVGRGGIVLIGEGPRSRTQRMLEDERRAVTRFLQNVPVSFLYVGPDADSLPLHKIPAKLRRLKPVLRKQEVLAVSNRLTSLGKNAVPIPKGIDPYKTRAPRPR